MQFLAPLGVAMQHRDIAERSAVVSDKAKNTVVVKRTSKVRTDERGQSVWSDTVETANLELVSTQMLKGILTSRDASELEAIRDSVNLDEDGVLARSPESGSFEIITNEELEEILASNDHLPEIRRPADSTLEPLRDYAGDEELALVSTLALRKVLRDGDDTAEDPAEEILDDGSFDPYNSG